VDLILLCCLLLTGTPTRAGTHNELIVERKARGKSGFYFFEPSGLMVGDYGGLLIILNCSD